MFVLAKSRHAEPNHSRRRLIDPTLGPSDGTTSNLTSMIFEGFQIHPRKLRICMKRLVRPSERRYDGMSVDRLVQPVLLFLCDIFC